MKLFSAAVFALASVALAGAAQRLDAPPVLFAVGGPAPSIDWTQVSAILASVAAALMSAAKLLEQVRAFVDQFRSKPSS